MIFARIGFWFGATCAGSLLPMPAFAWELVGFQEAKFSEEIDTASVEVLQVTLADNQKQLRLCAELRPAHLRGVEVTFIKGSHQSINLGQLISRGSCADTIDLGEIKGDIKDIVIHYDRPPGRAPIIKVYAR
jgi:hypothetical protein